MAGHLRGRVDHIGAFGFTPTDPVAGIDSRLAEIDRRFALELPDYAAFASPTSVSVEEVQAQLGAGEGVVLFLVTPTRKPLPEESTCAGCDQTWVCAAVSLRSSFEDPGTSPNDQSFPKSNFAFELISGRSAD